MGAVGLPTQFAIRGHCGGEFNLLRCLVSASLISLITCRDPVPPDVFEPRISQARGLCVHKMVPGSGSSFCSSVRSSSRLHRERLRYERLASHSWLRTKRRRGSSRCPPASSTRSSLQAPAPNIRLHCTGTYAPHVITPTPPPGTSTRRGFGEIEERSNGNQPPQPHVSGRNAEKNGGMHAVS